MSRTGTEPVPFLRLDDRGLPTASGFVHVDAGGVLRIVVDDPYYSGCVIDPIACVRMGRALLGFNARHTEISMESFRYLGDQQVLAYLGDEESRVDGRGIWWSR